MTVPNYGVWVATPVSFTIERQDKKSPHIYLKFKDSPDSKEFMAAINVKSISKDSRLVYWPITNLDNGFTNALMALRPGFHPSPTGPSLDYVRSVPPLVDFGKGLLLPHDLPGPDNDIIDVVSPILRRAVMSDNARIYIFGSHFPGGIHDIHMNQGSLEKFHNGVGQDGGIFIYYPDEHGGRWDAIFLAFASQSIPSEGGGSITLEDLLAQ